MFTLTLKTRYAESDQGGIIHNSAYIVYLENARVDFLQKIGLDINELEKKGMRCAVVSQSVKYLRPLFSLQEIQVHVCLSSFSKARFFLSYEITCGEEKILRGQSEHCFLNSLLKPIPLPKEALRGFSKSTNSPTPSKNFPEEAWD